MAFGQFSGASMAGKRWTVAEQLSGAWAKPGTAKRVGHNRVAYTDLHGNRCYRLHLTDVVMVAPDGTVKLQDGGFATITTRRAMTQGLRHFGIESFSVWGWKKGEYRHTLCDYRQAERIVTPFACPFTFKP